MFNLYANASNPNSFLGLVAKNTNADNEELRTVNRNILAGMAVASILLLSVIANGAQAQKIAEMQYSSKIASFASIA